MAIKDLIPWKKPAGPLAVRREAGHPLAQFQREMDQLFSDFLSDWPGRTTNLLERQFGDFVPSVDVSESEKEICITAELPGMDEKAIEVSMTEGAVTIKGEKQEEREEKKGEHFRSERRYGMFERTIPLPTALDANKARASFKKGVLKITLPKTAEAQTSRKRIAVES